MEKIVSFKNVYKKFKSKTVLSGFSFDLREHAFLALLGNNGSGKTTTINLLTNLDIMDSGEIRVFDHVVSTDYVSYRKRFGIVLSSPFYIEGFSIQEYLKFCCRFQNVAESLTSQRIEEVSDLFQLQEHLKTPIGKLSSGLKMKVSLAASLVHNPDVLIYDEPFVNLDFQTVNDLIEILKFLKGKKTLLITSHSLDLISDLCDQFIVLQNGVMTHEVFKSNTMSVADMQSELRSKLIGNSPTVATNMDWLK